MLTMSFKIWGIANLIVFAIFAIALFPDGWTIGLLAVFFSALFSLPAVIIIYLFLQVLHRIRGTVLFSWAIFLFATAVTAFAAYALFNLWSGGKWHELDFILPLSLISGYSAVLLFSSSLHYLFLTFQYQNDNENY